MNNTSPWPARRLLAASLLLAFLTLQPGSTAHAQGACLVVDETNSDIEAGAQLDGLHCVTSLTGPVELYATWAVTDTRNRPVRVSLSAGREQQVIAELLIPGEAEPAAVLQAENGTMTEAIWPLQPADYELRFRITGQEGRFVFASAETGSSLNFSTSASGADGRRDRLRGSFERIGSLAAAADYVNWEIQDDDADRKWRLRLRGTPGHPVTVKIYGEDGSELLHEAAATGEHLDLLDLEFPVGINTLVLSPAGESEHAGYHLSLSGIGTLAEGTKKGPTGSYTTANRIDLDTGVSGQLDEHSTDYFHLLVAEADAGWQEVRLESESGLNDLCMDGTTQQELACWAVDSGSLLVPLIRIDAGEYWFRVRGNRNDQPDYTLTFAPVAAPIADTIAWAPSGNMATAFSLPESLSARFNHGGRSTSWFAFEVDSPGLYRVQLQASGNLRNLSVLDAGGVRIRQARELRLDNIPVRSGTNYVSIDADAGDYAVRVMRLSDLPQQQKAEPAQAEESLPVEASMPEELQEPRIAPRPEGVVVRNTDIQGVSVTPIRAGQDYTGIIDGSDAQFRFTLLADTPVSVSLTPPGDGQMNLRLTPSNTGWIRAREDGEPLEIEQWLPAGDYQVAVSMTNDSGSWYTLRLDELDPLDLPVSMAPLDAASARAIPGNLVLDVPASMEDMHFRLPVVDHATTLRVDVNSGAAGQLDVHEWPHTNNPSRLQKFDVDEDSGSFSVAVAEDTEYHVRLNSRGQEPWKLEFVFDDGVHAVEAADPREALELTMELDSHTVAAWSPVGQVLAGVLKVTNPGGPEIDADLVVHASDPRAHVTGLPISVSLAAGEEVHLPFELILPDDIRSDRPFKLTLGARNEIGQTATAMEEVLASCGAPHTSAQIWTPEPFAGLAYWNYALPAWGTEVSGVPSFRQDELIIDGRVSVSRPNLVTDGQEYHLDLGRDVTIHKVALQPVAAGSALDRLRDFEMAVSADGQEWTTVLKGSLTGAAIEQVLELNEPVTARHARLTALNSQGRTGKIALGEWKLLGPDAPPGPINLADHDLGGHLVHATVWPGTNTVIMDDAEPEVGITPELGPFEMVLAFHENRAALVRSFEWQDFESRRGGRSYIPSVAVQVSIDSPLGPWEHVADWQLGQFSEDDESTPELYSLELEEPVWARFIRFVETGEQVSERRTLNLPSPIRVFEQPGDEAYRSIVSEWGMDRDTAVYEHLNPEAAVLASATFGSNDSIESAAELASESSGFVQTGAFEAWYELAVPEGMNQLHLNVASSGSVALELEILTEDGSQVASGVSGEAMSVQAEPGTYFLRIAEPPRSIAFVWDNSGSVSPFSGMTYAALDAFAADIRPETEEVMLAVFAGGGANFLLPDWSGSADEVTRTLNAYDRSDGSSDAGAAIIETNQKFAGRVGSRALLLITDAEFSMSSTPDVWRGIADARTQIFTMHVSSASTSYSQDYMQDLARGTGGYYAATPTYADLETGFARADCLIRRPKPYHAEVSFEQQVLQPGQLAVNASAVEGSMVSGSGTSQLSGAIQVILDASGSMWQTLDGRFRYEIARDVLVNLVDEVLPADVPFALRAFGNREADVCRTDLEVSLAPLDSSVVSAVIAGIEPQPFAGTPLAESILLARQDLSGAGEPRTLVLITDGEESCDGDVEAAIEELRADGVDVVLNIIGFDFDAADVAAARERFRAWADLGGGQYFDAADAVELADALERSVAPSFEVFDEAGEVVARGTVGGPALDLPGGTYTVRIQTEPERILENVVIDGGTTEAVLHSLPNGDNE